MDGISWPGSGEEVAEAASEKRFTQTGQRSMRDLPAKQISTYLSPSCSSLSVCSFRTQFETWLLFVYIRVSIWSSDDGGNEFVSVRSGSRRRRPQRRRLYSSRSSYLFEQSGASTVDEQTSRETDGRTDRMTDRQVGKAIRATTHLHATQLYWQMPLTVHLIGRRASEAKLIC